jgi:hypothetical protein
VPHAFPEQLLPVADHVTPRLPASFATVAVKFNVCETGMPPRFGFSVTPIAPAAVTVIVAVAFTAPFATEVAVNVTVAGVGTAAGALYVTAAPDALDVGVTLPQLAPLQPAPESVQVTPLFCATPATAAANACVLLVATLAVAGDTVTVTAGAATIVMIAAADFVLSARDVDLRVTAAGTGTFAGAVYVMAAPDALEVVDSVPQDVSWQLEPNSTQVTPLFCGSFCTVAMNC